MDSLVLTKNELNDKFDQYHKINNRKISLQLLNDCDLDNNLSLFETNSFIKKIKSSKKLSLLMIINGEFPIDIDAFMSKVCLLVEEKLIDETDDNINAADNAQVGIWVQDVLGNYVFRNKIGELITDNFPRIDDNYDPELVYIQGKYYLVIPKPDLEFSKFYYYAFELSSDEMDIHIKRTLKELSIEASMLAHELKKSTNKY